MKFYGGREGIEGLHWGLHSDYGVSRESLLVLSDLEQPWSNCDSRLTIVYNRLQHLERRVGEPVPPSIDLVYNHCFHPTSCFRQRF